LYTETRKKLNIHSCPECTNQGCWCLTKKDPSQYTSTSTTTKTATKSGSRKSKQCRSQKGGYPTEYATMQDVLGGAEYVNGKYGNDVSLYQCPSCNKWHGDGMNEHVRTNMSTDDGP
jgi:hypothetical protein